METDYSATPFDKRVKKTKTAIKASFMALVRNKPMDEITVKEIMQQAGVNRATFYSHYSNIAELAADIEMSCAQHIKAQVDTLLAAYEEPTAIDAVRIAVDALLDDREGCLWVAGPNATGKGRDVLRRQAYEHWTLGRLRGSADDELVFTVFFDGAVDLLGSWALRSKVVSKARVRDAINCVAARLLK